MAKDSFTIGKKSVLLGVIVAILAINSCIPPEPFPNEPKITFKDLQYVNVEKNGFLDSLVLRFDFEDGDGDLGLRTWEVFEPYQDFDLIVDKDTTIVTLGSTEVSPPFYKVVEFVVERNGSFVSRAKLEHLSDTDIRPPYSCEDYDTLKINQERRLYVPQGSDPSTFDSDIFKTDTLFIAKNGYRNNIFVDFYIDRESNGNFELLDWAYETSEYGCGQSFHGRFPILDEDNLANGSSLQGTVKYSMLSLGFNIVLRSSPFKLKFFVIDRNLNSSDTVTTPEFTLEGLSQDL